MSRKAKLLEKIRNNPKDVSFEDLNKLLEWAGFILRQQHSGTSHAVYTKTGCPGRLTVPRHTPLKVEYVKQALLFIDEYGDLED